MKRTILIGNMVALALAVIGAIGSKAGPWSLDMLVVARLWSGLAFVPELLGRST